MLIGSSVISVYSAADIIFLHAYVCVCVFMCVFMEVLVPPYLSWIKNKKHPFPPADESMSADNCVTIRLPQSHMNPDTDQNLTTQKHPHEAIPSQTQNQDLYLI